MNIENQSELVEYLENSQGIRPGEIQKTINLRGGVSNKTIQIFFKDGSSWVMKQALPKLRVKGDWYSKPVRIFHEADAMRWFERFGPKNIAPSLIFEDRELYLLAMEGIALPFENFKTYLLNGPDDPGYFEKAGDLLGSIHSFATKNREKAIETFSDNSFFKTLRVDPYYHETIKRFPRSGEFLTTLISDTDEDAFTLTHGDYSPKNLLIKDGRLILLDHEVIHFGDGTFDLGFFICHLLSKANHLSKSKTQFFSGVELFFNSYYLKNTLTTKRQNRAVRHAIGCMLARVFGLSPLEYLTDSEKKRQIRIGEALIHDTPANIDQLVLGFKELLK